MPTISRFRKINRVNLKVASRYNWWLGAVASSGNFVNVNGNGNINANNASNTHGVRPIFCSDTMCRIVPISVTNQTGKED